MKRKILCTMICSILFCFLLAGCSSADSKEEIDSSGTKESEISTEGEANRYSKYADYTPEKAEAKELTPGENRNILIAYFSRSGNVYVDDSVDAVSSASLTVNGDKSTTGNAEQIAKWIQEETGGDLFLIQTEYTYPMDYEQAVEVGEGQDMDGYHPALASHVEDISRYDTIYLIYPIWHYTLSVPTCSFLDEYDLSGKVVYAYAANAGSGFADSIERIQELEPDAAVKEGIAVSQNEMENAKNAVLSTVREQKTEFKSTEQENAGINIQIGDTRLTATLEENESVEALRELLKSGGLTIQFSEYGGFEQVGDIGTSLPRNDVETTTSAGDIVLYSGNQLVMFYGSHSWAYTKIGKIDSTQDLQEILGNGSVTATFTLTE